jgi:hypothetical protein
MSICSTADSKEAKRLVTGVSGACYALDCGRDHLYALLNSGQIESYWTAGRAKSPSLRLRPTSPGASPHPTNLSAPDIRRSDPQPHESSWGAPWEGAPLSVHRACQGTRRSTAMFSYPNPPRPRNGVWRVCCSKCGDSSAGYFYCFECRREHAERVRLYMAKRREDPKFRAAERIKTKFRMRRLRLSSARTSGNMALS